MYQVTVEGRNLQELKKAVADINEELNSGILSGKVDKDLSVPKEEEVEEDKPLHQVIDEAVGAPTAATVILEKPLTLNEAPVEEAPYTPAVVSNVTVVVSTDGDVDSEGLTWDGRIHSSSKKKVANGTWRLQRGIDRDMVQAIKDEIRNRIMNPIAVATPEVPAAPITIVPPITPALPITPTAPPVVVEPVVVAPPVAPAAPSMNTGGHTLETFTANFPMILATLITEGKITQEYVNQLKEYFKVDEIWNISNEQKAEMFETFSSINLITKV